MAMAFGSVKEQYDMPVLKWFKGLRKGAGAKPAGLLGRLRRDQKGATLAMMAAAIIPMIGFVGSAVDMSRAYLVKTRLQQACDAGALAARRVMVGSALDANALVQGDNFFNINLRNGAYGAQNVSVVYTNALQNGLTVGIVHGEARADVPMTLMRVFGQETIEMTAACEAQLNVANNDIMFVLDVTGSMACVPADSVSTCDSYSGSNVVQIGGRFQTTEKTDSRIDGLRAAVKDFFSTIRTATSSSARLRVGFVPYASGVRVGDLLLTVPNSLSTGPINYQSRKANFTTTKHTPSTAAWSAWGNAQTWGTAITTGNCDKYGTNQGFTQGTTFTPSPTGNPAPAVPTTVLTGGSTPANVTSQEYRKKSWTGTNATNKTCVRESRTAVTSYTTRYAFTNWSYEETPFTVASFAAGNPLNLVDATTGTVASLGKWSAQELLTLAGASGFSPRSYTWDKCVEERLTGSDDVDSAPTSEANRWRPSWQAMTYTRTATPQLGGDGTSPNLPASSANYSVNYACPKAATRLAVMTQAQVDAYVDDPDFVALGYTYHDIGMLWGTRLMSSAGIFAADHGPAPNGKPVNRHIIFMTDGDMKPARASYSTYGIEALRANIGASGASDASLKTTHNARFLAACQAAKARSISVWVVSFAQALTTELTTCADANQAFQASSTAELRSRFQTIAQRIAELRLSR